MQTRVRKNLFGLLVSVAISVTAAACAVGLNVFAVRRGLQAAQAAHSMEPAERSRLLAESISEAMNGVALGLAVVAVTFVAALVFAFRLYREARESKDSRINPSRRP